LEHAVCGVSSQFHGRFTTAVKTNACCKIFFCLPSCNAANRAGLRDPAPHLKGNNAATDFDQTRDTGSACFVTMVFQETSLTA
jgi:hypothetical protein